MQIHAKLNRCGIFICNYSVFGKLRIIFRVPHIIFAIIFTCVIEPRWRMVCCIYFKIYFPYWSAFSIILTSPQSC